MIHRPRPARRAHRPGARSAPESAPESGAESGAVTAEAAMVLPTLVLLVCALAWLLSLGVTQVRVVDAARETARAAARSDSVADAVGFGQRVAPAGSRITVDRGAEEVTVRVSAPVRGPGGVFGRLGPVVLRSSAVAAVEPTS